MKFSMMAAVFAVALSFAVSGCKYSSLNSGNKGAGAGAGAGLGAAEGSDVASTGLDDSQEGPLDGAGVGDRPFDEYCTRCTDVDFAPVYFGFDSTVVPQGEIGKIDAVAQHLDSNADRVVVVEGNCDERGSNEYNIPLGENRAIMVANYLGQNGISSDRIETVSRGETNPAVAGSGEEAWSKNRRGEFIIWKK